jgi:hypothetical protein
MFRKCEIAIVTAGILPTESKCCATWAWSVARSGVVGALQQLSWLTGAILEQFAPQHAVMEQAAIDGALTVSGSSRAIRNIASKRTS